MQLSPTRFPSLSGRALALAAALCLAPLSGMAQSDTSAGDALDQAIAGEHRSEANRARDQYRHPKETLEFFGFRPDLTVVEIWPGAGWYTEILAPALRDQGRLYLAQYGDSAPHEYQHREMAQLKEKLEASSALYGAVSLTALDFSEGMQLAPAGSADLVVTFRNVHNWVSPGYGPENAAELAFQAMFEALKPGGVLGVVDHRWPDAANEDPQSRNGYISEERVIALAEGAGFRFDDRSDVNANPQDTHDHEGGVWRLPESIGESDRFTLRFVKPAE